MSNTINPKSLDVSSLFSSLPQTAVAKETLGLAGLATDFSSIRSGSYKKLVSAYYHKLGTEGKTQKLEKEEKNRKIVAANSNALRSAADELKRIDFTAVSQEEALGAVNKFISSYNAVIDTADDVNQKGVLRNTVWMSNMMRQSAGLLEDVGISIGDNNRLSVNEEKWKSAALAPKMTLFSGRNSMADKLIYKAAQITGAAGEGYSNTASAYKADGEYVKPSVNAMYETIM